MAYYQPPWIAKVVFNGKQIHLGRYETKHEAKLVEDVFRDRYNLPKTRKEIAAKAHDTLRRMGTYRNRYTVGK